MKKNKRMINDRAFRFLATEFSEEFHKNLNLPGKFKSILQNDVITGKQDNLRMDLLEEVEADGERIKERTILKIEHQSTKLTLEKMMQHGLKKPPLGAFKLSQPGFKDLLSYIESNF